jgi:hypothetical protein
MMPRRRFRSVGLSSATCIAFLVIASAHPIRALAQPDPTLSFYVPQSGSVATPTEGTGAAQFLRTCPNNDPAQSFPNNVRIKVVVRDGTGAPIVGIAAADICVRFNGGTAAQGFTGVGADSIIANGTWNSNPLCPTVTCLEADAPTDATGVTYITFRGSTPGSPGVGTRDPNRKWGHYDSNLPVFVLGVQLQGRLTSASALGSYVLRIKNFDVVDGLEATMDAGAHVSFRDLNVMSQEIMTSSSLTYWLDLDSNGIVNSLDFNLMLAHFNHDCTHPLNP